MKKIIICIIWLGIFSIFIRAEEKNIFVSTSYGFSITVPVNKNIVRGTYQMALFLLPASDEFSPNVGLGIQTFQGSINEFDKITTDQFKNLSIIIISRIIKKDQITYEYKGSLNEKKMHWYQKAIKKESTIYLITATALESQWESTSAILIDSVNSFKFIP